MIHCPHPRSVTSANVSPESLTQVSPGFGTAVSTQEVGKEANVMSWPDLGGESTPQASFTCRSQASCLTAFVCCAEMLCVQFASLGWRKNCGAKELLNLRPHTDAIIDWPQKGNVCLATPAGQQES